MAIRPTLARHIEFRSRALDRAQLIGNLSLDELPRTKQVVIADRGVPVEVEIDLAEDVQRRVMLTGHVRSRLSLACQRCLEPADWAIDMAIGGIVVTSDEAAADVPRDWEPILARGEMLDLHGLIDDELLLAMPMTVQCDRPGCRAAYDKIEATPAENSSSQKPNPFAALASLKRDADQSR